MSGILAHVKNKKPASDLLEAEIHFIEKLCSEFDNKLVYAKWVEKKRKSKKNSHVIFVVATYMVLLVKRVNQKNRTPAKPLSKTKKRPRFPGELRLKLHKQYQLLELRSISVFKNNSKQLELQFFKLPPLQIFTPLIPEIIRNLRRSIRTFTYGFPNDKLPGLFGVRDEDLLPLERFELEDYGPAYGFINTYSAYCCYYKQPISKEVIRYITDLHEAGIVEFCLHDCPGVDNKSDSFNILPIAEALNYNTYFKAISAVNIPRKDILPHLCNILKYNISITKIVFSQLQDGNIGDLGEALHYNRNNAVQIIDLSGTHISKGCSSFCLGLQNFHHSLKVLNLSSCALDGKHLMAIWEALGSNYGTSLTIEELDLSNNKFDDQSSSVFETWLSKAAEYSRLQVLKLSNINQTLSTVAAYFHFLSNLQELDISHNKLDQRAVQLICSMVEKSSTLSRLDVSHCNLTGRFAAAITEAFVNNKKLVKTWLNLSANELTEVDAEFLAKALSLNSNCHTFNLSKNKFKENGLIGILQSIVLSASDTLDTLILDNIYKPTYAGERVASALMSVTNSLPSVKSISIAGGFGTVAIPFINYLQNNKTLLELDISGDQIGDAVASAIAEMLRKNTTLLKLKCDGNNISPSGWKMILASFMHNHTIVEMDFPWNDYSRYQSLPPDKLEELRAVLIDIQRALQTNYSEEKFSRLRPPPTRPLPTYIHPSAHLPVKLFTHTSKGLSSLAACKINVDREDLMRDREKQNLQAQQPNQPNQHNPVVVEQPQPNTDVHSAEINAPIATINEPIIDGNISGGDPSLRNSGGIGNPGIRIQEWSIDPDGIPDTTWDGSDDSVESEESETTPRFENSITLATLHQPKSSSDERATNPPPGAIAAEDEENSVMSSDSEFDF